MFNSSDLYSVSGGVQVFNYWNPFVTKHDTSSFYNWEQDNLPLYDLEERSLYLWEKLGYPLSTVPGMAYVVSASVPDIQGSGNVFTSLSAAVDALPEVIRTPTLIEVAVSGSVGELNLDNIKIVDDGVLDIINRVYSPLSENGVNNASYMTTQGSPASPYYIPTRLSASALFSNLSSTSAISVSANTATLSRYGVNNGTAAEVRNLILPGRQVSGGGSWEDLVGYCYVGTTAGSTRYQYDHLLDPTYISDVTIGSHDLSTVQEYNRTGAVMPSYTNEQLARGLWTGNRLSKISIQNCDGPIYVRGFIVDGESSTTTGIGVYASEGVTLENCGAMRCTEVGFDFKNSKVDLRRQAIAARNYDVNDRGTLTTYGFKAVDSNINFVVDTYASGCFATFGSHFHDYGLYLENSVVEGGDKIASTAMTDTFYSDFGYNDVGIYCSNSKFALDGVTTSYNNRINIEAVNSVVEVEQLRSVLAQSYGMVLNNSNFTYNKNISSAAKGATTAKTNAGVPKYHNYPILFYNNGQHLILEGGSTYGPTYPIGTSAIDVTEIYNQEVYYQSHGFVSEQAYKPSVVVNNSVGEFTCAKFIGNVQTTNVTNRSIPSLLHVTNNGTAVVRGTKSLGTRSDSNGACYFESASTSATTAIVADNHSNVHLTGPVAIYNVGIGALARNGSTIKVAPPLDRTHSFTADQAKTPLQFSGWGDGIYPSVPTLEIHSHGPALAVENNSNLILRDLGDYNTIWDASRLEHNDYFISAEYADLIASGAVQLYCNPAGPSFYGIPGEGDSAEVNNFYGMSIADNKEYTARGTTSLKSHTILHDATYDDATFRANVRTVSLGGPAVVASKGSSVEVQNVHFPMGQANPDESYFDASASPAGCSNYMIWNIQDTSRLHASYCSVSGIYPASAVYTGPRAHYFSGTLGLGNDASTVNLTLPSGTPDTSTLAVLDYYGSGVTLSSSPVSAFPYMKALQKARTGVDNTYGESNFENRGPFRLYFSVDPAAKALSYFYHEVGDTLPYQHLSQGYLLSGDCSAVSDLSSMYPALISDEAFARDGYINTSGYYYPSSMLPTEGATVWLDESAANIFANAKHCNTAYSATKKLVNIYNASLAENGESFVGNVQAEGLGFRTSNIFDSKRDN